MDVRLFIAIEITDTIRKNLSIFQNDLKKTSADIKWVAPENLHITLKFIGATDDDKIGNIITVINQSVVNIKPFDLCYMGAGVFPAGKNPRVIFAKAVDSNGVLTTIYEKLNSQLSVMGITYDERKFEAHVTVGRVKTRKNINNLMDCINSYRDFTFGNENIDHLVLMKSDLSREGPTYTRLNTISFG
ncbi:MAG: RNA 2',3'-cyclic phosphodiesterase [Candidatus Kuenenia sp.]|nr:RNA 2',3'-cyclic phosphodiesterase [Candidatus Kuenenia hertensis]